MDLPQMSFTDFSVVLSAVAALGTAASGLVDTSKAFAGGISNVGFRFIKDALSPFENALRVVDAKDPFEIAQANWLNGMDKAEQKTIAKNMIRLGLTSATATELAGLVPSVSADTLKAIAGKLELGTVPDDFGLAALGRFEAVVDARLNAAFESRSEISKLCAHGSRGGRRHTLDLRCDHCL